MTVPAALLRKIDLELGVDPNHDPFAEEHLVTSLDSVINKSYKNENENNFFTSIKHEFLTVICANCGVQHAIQIACGYRCCPSCSKIKIIQRRKYLMGKFSGVMALRDNNRGLRELTLTFENVKSMDGWLSTFHDWIVSFRRSFEVNKKLSNYKIIGGCANIEITRNLIRKDWHIHIHLAIEGNYIPQKIIIKQWKKTTNGMGRIADIRKITNGIKSAWEIAKYSTKPHN
ncbi:unnamed protein product, partial [marine sediment metagenome]